MRTVYVDRVIGVAPRDALLLDCSTIDLPTARGAAALAAEAGYAMADAPVSGGIAAAGARTLTFMVGGPAASYRRAVPVLEPMAKAAIHAGESGAGQVVKMYNNRLLVIHMIGTSEALAFAAKSGLDP